MCKIVVELLTLGAPAHHTSPSIHDNSPCESSPPALLISSSVIEQNTSSTTTKPRTDKISPSHIGSGSRQPDSSTDEDSPAVDPALGIAKTSRPDSLPLRVCRPLQQQLDGQILCTQSKNKTTDERVEVIAENMVSTGCQCNAKSLSASPTSPMPSAPSDPLIPSASSTPPESSKPSEPSIPSTGSKPSSLSDLSATSATSTSSNFSPSSPPSTSSTSPSSIPPGLEADDHILTDEGYFEGGEDYRDLPDRAALMANLRQASGQLGMKRSYDSAKGAVYAPPRMRRKIVRRKRPDEPDPRT